MCRCPRHSDSLRRTCSTPALLRSHSHDSEVEPHSGRTAPGAARIDRTGSRVGAAGGFGARSTWPSGPLAWSSTSRARVCQQSSLERAPRDEVRRCDRRSRGRRARRARRRVSRAGWARLGDDGERGPSRPPAGPSCSARPDSVAQAHRRLNASAHRPPHNVSGHRRPTRRAIGSRYEDARDIARRHSCARDRSASRRSRRSRVVWQREPAWLTRRAATALVEERLARTWCSGARNSWHGEVPPEPMRIGNATHERGSVRP